MSRNAERWGALASGVLRCSALLATAQAAEVKSIAILVPEQGIDPIADPRLDRARHSTLPGGRVTGLSG